MLPIILLPILYQIRLFAMLFCFAVGAIFGSLLIWWIMRESESSNSNVGKMAFQGRLFSSRSGIQFAPDQIACLKSPQQQERDLFYFAPDQIVCLKSAVKTTQQIRLHASSLHSSKKGSSSVLYQIRLSAVCFGLFCYVPDQIVCYVVLFCCWGNFWESFLLFFFPFPVGFSPTGASRFIKLLAPLY